MIRPGWQQELFSEKTFLDLYRTASRHVSVEQNNIATILIFLTAFTPICLGFLGAWEPIAIKSLVAGVRAVANVGVAFATSILGFLVSGFALFFAITRSDVLILLAGIDHDKGDISRLQFILYSFMYVFFHYILYLAVVLGISVTLSQGSVLVSTAAYWRGFCPCFFRLVVAFLFSASAAWLIFIILLLKTFVWNLFQTVLIAITVGADMDSGRLNRLIEEIKKQ